MINKKFYFLLIAFVSCSQKNFKPAEDALDAAREFKDGYLKGDFDKAKFYLFSNNESEKKFSQLIEQYQLQTKQQQKESKEASIIIESNKEISSTQTQVILTNSFDKNLDTINVIRNNNLWLVNLK